MKVHLSSSIHHREVEIDVEFRPIPVLSTGRIVATPIIPGRSGVIYQIEWAPNDAVANVLRKAKKPVPARLAPGYARQDPKVGAYVEFLKYNLRVRTADKPDLHELWQWLMDWRDAEQVARDAYWEREAEQQREAITSEVPDGSVLVNHVGSAPDPWEAGMSIRVWESADGRRFSGEPDRAVSGTGYITEERLARASQVYVEAQKRDAEMIRQQREKREQYQAALALTVVPETALAAYRRYRGDAELAWSKGDEGAWAEIQQFASAIEAQGLAAPSAEVMRREMRPEDLSEAEGK